MRIKKKIERDDFLSFQFDGAYYYIKKDEILYVAGDRV